MSAERRRREEKNGLREHGVHEQLRRRISDSIFVYSPLYILTSALAILTLWPLTPAVTVAIWVQL